MAVSMLDEEAIFNVARRIERPEARGLYLDSVCGDDKRLRERLEALLRVHEEGQSFFESAATPTAAGTAVAVSEQSGTQIGPYQLIEQIGEGGFGVVFRAEQQQPLHRSVALKILKPGMDSREVVGRFQAERQTLALMDHPNIARVLDGGETAGGRPYFVMELVKGVPITGYSDEHQLTPRERLVLFVAVCGAVEHAHQKGIIHRDLKPTNVIVAAYDGKSVPKVIDFGVAKALGQRLTDRTLVTGVGGIVGTLEYMSPEAAEARDIDTRADIYSLGVLLYELLTGTTPLTKERLKQAAMSEVLRAIRQEEPPKPSARLRNEKALRRFGSSFILRPSSFHELDWIVMKALEKDRNRRYATANALARDIERYLQDEPVEACPPSAWYKLRKFAGKNRKLLGAAAAFALLLTAGIIVSTWLAVRALQAEQAAGNNATWAREALAAEAQRRRQTRDALEMLTSEVIDEWLARQQELLPEHRKFLEKAVASYEELARDTGQEEASRASVALALQRVGTIRWKLGQMAEAETAYRRSRDLYQQLVADFPSMPGYRLELGASHANMGTVLWDTGRARDAEHAYREAVRLQQQLAADFPTVALYRYRLAATQTNLGSVLRKLGRPQDAEHAYREALKLHQQSATELPAAPAFRQHLADIHDNLGNVLCERNQLQDAEDAYRQALKLEQRLAADFPSVPSYRHGLAGTHSNLGNVLQDAGRAQEAEQAYREALKLEQQLAADFPSVPAYRERLATVHSNLGNVLKHAGRAQDAEQAYREALKLQQQLVADFPTVPAYRTQLVLVHNNQATLLHNTGQAQGAEHAYREALKLGQQLVADFPTVPAYREQLAMLHGNLGTLLQATGRVQDAEHAYREALKLAQQLAAEFPTVPAYRERLAWLHNDIGTVLRYTGRPQDAERALGDAIEVYQQLTAEFPNLADYRNGLAGAMVNLAGFLRRSGKPGQARQVLEQAVPHHQAALQANPRNPQYRLYFRNNRWGLAETLLNLGDHAAAADVAAQLSQAGVDQRADVYNAACILARCLSLAKRDTQLSEARHKERAEAYADRAMATLRQAVQNGYKDVEHMKKDPDLDSLRPRADFQKLLAELQATAPSPSK